MMSAEIELVEPETRSPAEMRGKILALEAAMLAQPELLVEFPLEHYFAPGIYMRQMTVPKGGTLTGKIHKTEHLCVLAKGEVSVWTEGGMKRLTAPAVVHSLPGIKRAMHAHEDSVWINVHHNPTNEWDLEKIEEIYTAESFEALQGFMEQKQIAGGG